MPTKLWDKLQIRLRKYLDKIGCRHHRCVYTLTYFMNHSPHPRYVMISLEYKKTGKSFSCVVCLYTDTNTRLQAWSHWEYILGSAENNQDLIFSVHTKHMHIVSGVSSGRGLFISRLMWCMPLTLFFLEKNICAIWYSTIPESRNLKNKIKAACLQKRGACLIAAHCLPCHPKSPASLPPHSLLSQPHCPPDHLVAFLITTPLPPQSLPYCLPTTHDWPCWNAGDGGVVWGCTNWHNTFGFVPKSICL